MCQNASRAPLQTPPRELIALLTRCTVWVKKSPLRLGHIKCDYPVHICSKCPPSAETRWHFLIFFRTGGNFKSEFYTPIAPIIIYARLQNFIHLSPSVTKLCHIKCYHPECVSVDGGHFEHMMVTLNTRPVSHSRFSPTPADSVLCRRQLTHIG